MPTVSGDDVGIQPQIASCTPNTTPVPAMVLSSSKAAGLMMYVGNSVGAIEGHYEADSILRLRIRASCPSWPTRFTFPSSSCATSNKHVGAAATGNGATLSSNAPRSTELERHVG